MSWWSRILGGERKAAQLTYDQIADLLDGGGAYRVAGLTVNTKTALQVATVLACVRAIADGCATPKLNIYREAKEKRRELATNIPEFRLLARRPNEWQTSFEWRRMMTLHAALHGAGLSIKVRGENRRVRELIPVAPGYWQVERLSRYELLYTCRDELGTIGQFGPEDVFLLPNVQWEWVRSLSALSLARSSIGLAMASERSHAAFHENGVRPSGVYSVEGGLSPEQHERLQKHLVKHQSGVDKTGLPLVLDRAAKWVSTRMTGADAQHVETRRLQVEEICRAFGVFPIMIGHSDKAATFASSEAFFAAHVKHTLAPWHEAWTQRIDEMLLDGAGPLWAEFDTRYLIAGSMKDRAVWARTMGEMGIYTRNELRDEEGKDPLPGLDEPLTPLNMSGGGEPPADDEPKDGEARARVDALERKVSAIADQRRSTDGAAEIMQRLEALDRRFDVMQMQQRPASTDMRIDLRTADVENTVGSAIQRVTDAAVEKMKAVAADMPITINVPEQLAPVVHVHVDPTPVTLEAIVQPAPVVLNGPKSSEQRVERDGNDEIVRTVTTHNY